MRFAHIILVAVALLSLVDVRTVALAHPLPSGIQIVFPLVGSRISSKYGKRVHPVRRVHRHHGGIDLAAPPNSHVRAVASGTVVFVGNFLGYGKLITIRHEGERFSLYGHLSEYLVNPGQQVKAGDLIGRVGATGLASGPHLHFEWRESGNSVDPLSVFPALASTPEG